MEHSRRKPLVWLTFGALMLGVMALSQLASGPRGPVCAEAPLVQPGFTGLAAGPTAACIRIRLP